MNAAFTTQGGIVIIMLFSLFSVSASGGANVAQGGGDIGPHIENVSASIDESKQRTLNNLTGASETLRPLVAGTFDAGKGAAVSGLQFGYSYPILGSILPPLIILSIVAYCGWLFKRVTRKI